MNKDRLQFLIRQIYEHPANANSNPDDMGSALEDINMLAEEALKELEREP